MKRPGNKPPKRGLTQAQVLTIVACIVVIGGISYALPQFFHSLLPTQTFTAQKLSTPIPTIMPTLPIRPTLTVKPTRVPSPSCTDTEYVANSYHLVSSYPQAKGWFGWLRDQGWTADGWPNTGDILVMNANEQGAGPEGYVGIIQQPVTATGSQMWRLMVRSTIGPSDGEHIADAYCSNVANFLFDNLSAVARDRVAFFHK